MRTARVVVKRAAAGPLSRGHPWVWREAIVQSDARETAQEVAIQAEDGTVLGHGLFDPGSPIAVRVWGEGRIDEALFLQRLVRAMRRRERLFPDGETTAYRLVHGEGDRMPGVVIDRYGPVAVVRPDGMAADALVTRHGEALAAELSGAGVRSVVLRRPKAGTRGFETVALHGEPAPETLVVREHGVPFVVDLARGQKTGAFLDQRENRRRVGGLSAGKRVLNLFSYAGGFSLWAAVGGAKDVTSVDVAAGAHATAEASFRAAGQAGVKHELVTADAFAFLEGARRRGATWDVVISDPPSFAPSERALPRALASYRALHKACAAVIAPGGTLCASSCSSHVDAVAFTSTLDDQALARADLSLLELFGAPADHPTVAAWPEGRYLKFAILG